MFKCFTSTLNTLQIQMWQLLNITLLVPSFLLLVVWALWNGFENWQVIYVILWPGNINTLSTFCFSVNEGNLSAQGCTKIEVLAQLLCLRGQNLKLENTHGKWYTFYLTSLEKMLNFPGIWVKFQQEKQNFLPNNFLCILLFCKAEFPSKWQDLLGMRFPIPYFFQARTFSKIGIITFFDICSSLKNKFIPTVFFLLTQG